MLETLDYDKLADRFAFEESSDHLYFVMKEGVVKEVGSRDEALAMEDVDGEIEWMTVQDAVFHLVKCGCVGTNYHTSRNPFTQLATAVIRHPKTIRQYGVKLPTVYTGIRSTYREGRKVIFAAFDKKIAEQYGNIALLKDARGIVFKSPADSVISGFVGDCDIEVVIPGGYAEFKLVTPDSSLETYITDDGQEPSE